MKDTLNSIISSISTTTLRAPALEKDFQEKKIKPKHKCHQLC